MNFRQLLADKNITSYQLSKKTGIPYSTINDLVNGKTVIGNMRFFHVIKIADALDTKIDTLSKLSYIDVVEFRYFRNNLLAELKRKGANQFVDDIISSRTIDYYYKNNKYEYALYLLALIDYLCLKNNRPCFIRRYNKIRKEQLKEPLFVGSDLLKFKSIKEAEEKLGIKVLPEFGKYNIIEDNVYGVA